MRFNIANQLTILRILLIPAFVFFLFIGYRNSAVSVFLVACATDWLDGFIARKYDLVTNFGKFMDPLADKLLVAAALISMIELEMITAWIVIIIVSREFIVSGFRLIAAGNDVVIAAGIWGKAKTVAQMIMIIYLLMGFGGIIADILIWGAVILTIVSGAEYIIKNWWVLKDGK
ncbi:MAG: CDP-diacylglycerol--glycerol-3-phosphate 3-phosphatidyltransferase [Defluviitaleaceae bacterium]|nr:CDP-diacylglycerol--glycerol-3-phosphate 3-phosphatidyltransferase [Defluviitaleaceae bacterium]